MSKYEIVMKRIIPLVAEHKKKVFRIEGMQEDIAILEEFSDFLRLDLSTIEGFYPRQTDHSSKTFKSAHPRIRNVALVYAYHDSSVDRRIYVSELRLRSQDEGFVVDCFEELAKLVSRWNAGRAFIDLYDCYPSKAGLGFTDLHARRVCRPENRTHTSQLTAFELFAQEEGSGYPLVLDYEKAACALRPFVAKVAVVPRGLLFCAPKVTMDTQEFYDWNSGLLNGLGLYGYGRLPTERELPGRFSWHKDGCADFLVGLPDDLAERLYQESPLKWENHGFPISFRKSLNALNITLPGIETFETEKEFWDLYLKKYLGEHEAAIDLMMHQYDRFL